MPRVAVFTEWGEPLGGMEQSLLQTVANARGVQVVAVMPSGTLADRFRAVGIEVRVVGAESWVRPSLREVLRLRSEIRRSAADADIWHFQSFAIGSLVGLPPGGRSLVIHHRGANPVGTRAQLLAWPALRLADAVVTPSGAAARVAIGLGARHDRVHVIHNPVQTIVPVERSAARETLGLDRNAYLVAQVGRLHPIKRFEMGLEAFAALRHAAPDAQLLQVFTGPYEENRRYLLRLRELAEALGIEGSVVQMYGARPMAVILGAADVFWCTSEYEAFGRVVAEALSAGVPVVTTPGGALRELFDTRARIAIDAPELARTTLSIRQAGRPSNPTNPFSPASIGAAMAELYVSLTRS